jgi:hypothetical protein
MKQVRLGLENSPLLRTSPTLKVMAAFPQGALGVVREGFVLAYTYH